MAYLDSYLFQLKDKPNEGEYLKPIPVHSEILNATAIACFPARGQIIHHPTHHIHFQCSEAKLFLLQAYSSLQEFFGCSLNYILDRMYNYFVEP